MMDVLPLWPQVSNSMTVSARSAPPLLGWLKKEGLPKPLLRLQHLLKKAIETTQTNWETLERVYGWVHQLAHVLGEKDIRLFDELKNEALHQFQRRSALGI
ncbi:MAG TPA: hypothetical protein VGL94_17640 [Ktedonobacteraceae bacterium]|jgi:hypothetical protein